MTLNIETTQENGQHTFTLQGDLDAASAPTLRQSLQPTLASNPSSVVLDFGGVEFLDSTGIGAVIQAYKHMSKAGGKFKLTGMKGQPLQTFTFLKLNHLIEAV